MAFNNITEISVVHCQASIGVLSRTPAGTYPSHQRGSRSSCPFCQRRCAATATQSGRTKGSYPTGQVRRKEKGCPYISYGHMKLDGLVGADVSALGGIHDIPRNLLKFRISPYGSTGEVDPHPYGSVLHKRKCRPSMYRGERSEEKLCDSD